jgi:HlyD family secretion protein
VAEQMKTLPSAIRQPITKFGWLAMIVAGLIVLGGAGWYVWRGQTTTTVSGEALQTATVRRGNIKLSASGTATLNPHTSAPLRFRGSGQVVKLNVGLGSRVTAGTLLASLNDSAAQLALTQAIRALQELTSPAAIQTQMQNISTARTALSNARETLANYISPDVLNFEETVARDQKDLQAASAQQAASPSEENARKVSDAQTALQQAQAGLAQAQAAAGTYLWNAFSYQDVSIYSNCKPHTPCSPSDQTSFSTTIYSPPSADTVMAARSAYAAAQKNLADEQAYLNVLTTGNIPAGVLGAKITALETARQAVTAAQDTLNGVRLVAPIAGTVTALNFGLGDSVTSTSAITVADIDQPYYVDIYMNETDWTGIKVGDGAEVTLDILPDTVLAGKLISIDPNLTTQNGALYIHGVAQLDPRQGITLPMGTGGSVDIIGGQAQNALLVPVTALHKIASGQYFVFVMANGKLILRPVEIGLRDLVNAEVTSGLQAGDVVSTGIAQAK